MANTTFHPFLAVHRPVPPDSRYFGQLPSGFGYILLHFVALHQSIRSDQPGVEQLHKYPDDVGAGGKWEKGDVGSGHLGIPAAVNEAVQHFRRFHSLKSRQPSECDPRSGRGEWR